MNGNITGYSYFTNSSIGGGRSVIDQTHLLGKITNGAVIENPPAIGGVIFEGDLGEYSFSTKRVKHLRVYKLAEAITDASTALKFYKTDFTHIPTKGDLLMVAPSDPADSYLYVVAGDVTASALSNGTEIYSVAITAGSLGSGVSVTKDSLFVNATAIGSIEGYSVGAAGTGYIVGDLITVTSTGASGGVFEVKTIVAETGAIATVEQVSKGTGYAVAATQLATTTDSLAGDGAKIVVSAVGAKVTAIPNVAFSTDVPIEYAPSTSFTSLNGAVYNSPLYNVCTLWKTKASPIPAYAEPYLRGGAFTDIKIFG